MLRTHLRDHNVSSMIINVYSVFQIPQRSSLLRHLNMLLKAMELFCSVMEQAIRGQILHGLNMAVTLFSPQLKF